MRSWESAARFKSLRRSDCGYDNRLFIEHVFNPKEGPTDAERAYGGNPGGALFDNQKRPTLLFRDTHYFKTWKHRRGISVDLALLNIGGHFGMEPRMVRGCFSPFAQSWQSRNTTLPFRITEI